MKIKNIMLIVLFIIYNICLVFSYQNQTELTERIIKLQSSVNEVNSDLDSLELDVKHISNQIVNF